MLRYGLALVALSICVAAGCAAESGDGAATGGDDDKIVHNGDGSGDDEIVSERQLNGLELPDHTISLTFDDGPGERTAELADFLGDHGIVGTFFMNGMKAPGRQNHIDEIVRRGHLLANHTQNHKQLTKLGAAAIVAEVEETDAIIRSVQPNGPWLLRAPFGAWNGTVARAVNATAMRKYVGSIFWDEGGELTKTAAADWACWRDEISPEDCGRLYMQEIRTKRRGVVLMHDIHNRTVDMVKFMVPLLEKEGFKFASVGSVPSVVRAVAAQSGKPPAPDQCMSTTLGRAVDQNVCVQSKSTAKWFRCLDGEWVASTGQGDTLCKQRFPLQ
jgi:peptidoglycan/xylan/chitin deacetylase (PgdA/CDA1 family)